MSNWSCRYGRRIRRVQGHLMRLTSVLAVLAMTMLAVPAVAFAATDTKGQLWNPPQTELAALKPVPGTYAPSRSGSSASRQAVPSVTYKVPPVDLPKAGSDTVTLAGAGTVATGQAVATAQSATKAVAVRVGTTPVWVAAATTGTAAPAKVQVRFADPATVRKAGIASGLLFGVARRDASSQGGEISLQVDPELLAGEGGGNLAQRLNLVELPACALTTPNLSACQIRTPVKSTVDPATGRLVVTADLAATAAKQRSTTDVTSSVTQSAGMTVLAAQTAPAGSAGTYAATSIKPSDQWSEGGDTGDFSYSYPVTVPPALGGAAPNVSLSYASSAVDGETVSTNSQASAIGDGWSGPSAFIERSYQPCSQDGITGSGDSCWTLGGHEVSMSGGNLGGQMVWDDATSTWHMSGTAASVKMLTGAPNTAYNGEYWQVTLQDGTREYFGAGKLPSAEGGTGSDGATNSVSTEPVYCPKAGDCDGATAGANTDFTANMPYRWYLDFVVDPHGNTTEYNYGQETNYYARSSAHTDTVYDRSAYLTSISYGWRSSDIATEAAKPAPAAKILFAESNRCLVMGDRPRRAAQHPADHQRAVRYLAHRDHRPLLVRHATGPGLRLDGDVRQLQHGVLLVHAVGHHHDRGQHRHHRRVELQGGGHLRPGADVPGHR